MATRNSMGKVAVIEKKKLIYLALTSGGRKTYQMFVKKAYGADPFDDEVLYVAGKTYTLGLVPYSRRIDADRGYTEIPRENLRDLKWKAQTRCKNIDKERLLIDLPARPRRKRAAASRAPQGLYRGTYGSLFGHRRPASPALGWVRRYAIAPSPFSSDSDSLFKDRVLSSEEESMSSHNLSAKDTGSAVSSQKAGVPNSASSSSSSAMLNGWY